MSPTEAGLYLMRSGLEGACMCEGCLADFETIRDDFASLDDCLSFGRRLSQHRNVS
jgi:hypothetical protein